MCNNLVGRTEGKRQLETRYVWNLW